MMFELSWKLPFFLVLILASAFFSGSEAALFSLGRYRLLKLHRTSVKKFTILQKMLESPTKLIGTLLVGNEIINTAIGVVGSSIVYEIFSGFGLARNPLLPILSVLILLPFLIILCDLIPKAIGLKVPEKVVLFNSRPLWFFHLAVRPVRNLVNWFPEQLFRLFRVPPKSDSVSEEIFRVLVDKGYKEGVLDLQEKQLIHNVFKIDDLVVTQIMTQKNQVVYLTENMSVDESLVIIEREGYSRYPVLNEERNKVVGVLYAKDLLGLSESTKKLPMSSFLRPPLVIHTNALVVELFFQFRMKRTHFAVVANEVNQQLSGVVTLEDVLEEIFGVLKDERDDIDV
ncbi:MAG: HlyC/CorC family transporter [Bdellovibrionales bacterium]|nr:HlyC/CorC family transporter [Bdellovibrionales bacterium]